MKTPFTTDQFLAVFEQYNQSVFPAQIIILILGLLSLFFVFMPSLRLNKLPGIIIALMWLWAGTIYHFLFFTKINSAAFGFGALFVIQGLIVLIITAKKDFKFKYVNDLRGNTGLLFVSFGLIIYPLISYFMKGSTDLIISAGLPCPTVITTFGFFALANIKLRWWAYVIPVIWSFIGLSAALNFGIYQDFLMLIAAFMVIIVIKRAQYEGSTFKD